MFTSTTSSLTHPSTTGHTIRLSSRNQTLATPTPGLAPQHLQANLIVLPSRFAVDFRALCQRNPVPCPLLAESASVGDYSKLKSYIPGVSGEQIAQDLDLRRDVPRYTVYRDGVEIEEPEGGRLDVVEWWDAEDHVAFLIGCSFSFEGALVREGLGVTHITHERNVPMYRTRIRLCDAGRFEDRTYVVSMRPYGVDEIETVKRVTRPFALTHGEPIAWGWESVEKLGIENIERPEFGDPPVCADGTPFTRRSSQVPVFWGCGVTPQDAVMGSAIPGVVLGHKPGHMLVLDLKEDDLFPNP